MESRFPQRVALERQVLDLVNSSASVSRPLVGLASVTVNAWLGSLPPSLDSRKVAALAIALRLSAEAARSEADVSDEIFIDIDDADAEAAIDRLREALSGL